MTVIFGGVAVILVLIAGGLVLHTGSFLAGSVSTTGTVIELIGREDCSTDDDRRRTCRTVYAPTVRFTTSDGRQVDYRSRTATGPSLYREGQQVEVRYRPDDPTDARIDAFTDLWLAPLIVGGVGVIFGVVTGVLGAVAFRLRDRTEKPVEPVEPDDDAVDEPEPWQDPGTLR